MEKLSCVLCRGAYREPRMCSTCSEIYCRNCIENYIKRHHCCPNCNQVLPELANCARLINELKEHVKPKQKSYKICLFHNLPLNYICVDCAVPICSDCGVIEASHRGHKLQARGSATKQVPKARLREYLVSIEQCILRDHSKYQQLVLQKQVVKSELRWSHNKLREYYQEMCSRLDKQADQLTAKILEQLNERGCRLQKLRRLKDQIGQVLQLKNLSLQQMSKIGQGNTLVQDLQLDDHQQIWRKVDGLIEDCQDQNFISVPHKSLATLNQVYPEYVNHTFQMDYTIDKDLPFKYSPPFDLYGNQWRLKIYPKGNLQNSKHLALFLQLIDCPVPLPSPQQYYYRLQLISLQAAGKTISKQYRSPFAINDCWGYNDFVRLQQLQQYLNNGRLIFVVGLRNCSFYDVCQNMRRYIRKLQGQNKVLQDLLNSSNLTGSHLVLRQDQSLATSRLLQETSNIVDSD